MARLVASQIEAKANSFEDIGYGKAKHLVAEEAFRLAMISVRAKGNREIYSLSCGINHIPK